MTDSEFDIIQHYFVVLLRDCLGKDALSVGDDCAITEHRENQRITNYDRYNGREYSFFTRY